MNMYDACCPACGRENKSLYLDETGGWMECTHCGMVVKITYKRKPAFTVGVPNIKQTAVVCTM